MTATFRNGVLIVAGVVITILTIQKWFKGKSKQGSREPPCIPSIIPYIGHIFAFFWYKNAYYLKLSNKWKLPIFSLSTLGGKIHIIGSPELLHTLHRQPKTISLWSLEAQFTSQLGGMSKASTNKLMANLCPHSQDPSFLIQGLDATRQAMSPQGGMNEMLLAAVNVTKERLDSLHQGIHRTEVDLWAWTQHELTVITTESVYGPGNPYKDPKVEVGFWDFADDTIKLLLTNILPNIVASKALAGREVVVQAMDSYFSCGAYKEGSSLVKARHAALKDGEIPDLDLARCECVNGIAILANTVPTAFWTIFHIFSDPLVLTEVRRQVGLITTYQVLTEGGGPAYKINLSRLNDAPIIFSALQEALRLRATGTGPRMVLADTFIGPHQYLLKKGSVVMIVNKALHSDKGAWGEKADTYHPDRFYGKFPAQSFRGFGGGVNLCPGRGFAMVEVAALVAMLAMRFDLVPAGETWSEPDQDLTNLSLQVAPPKQKVTVNIVPRHDFEEASWYFEL